MANHPVSTDLVNTPTTPAADTTDELVPLPGVRVASEVWSMISGGLAWPKDADAVSKGSGRPPKGAFGMWPGATPKYAANDGTVVDTDYREQMARMFIQVSNYADFLDEFKDDETKQIAGVIAGTVTDTGTSGGNGYIDFLLQNVQHALQEKSQIVETLADDHVAYFFGQGAAVFNYSGTALNTKQDDQAQNLYRLYSYMGRGSMLAQRKTLVSIRYDGRIVSGVMMNLQLGLNAETEMAVPFSFSLLVKQIIQLPNRYNSVVPLTKPFAIEGDGYATFSTGAVDLPGSYVLPIAAPPAYVPQPKPVTTPEEPKSGVATGGFDLLERMVNGKPPTNAAEAALSAGRSTGNMSLNDGATTTQALVRGVVQLSHSQASFASSSEQRFSSASLTVSPYRAYTEQSTTVWK